VFFTLEWEIASLAWAAWGGKPESWLNILFGAIGAAAILMILISRLIRVRFKWLLNVFKRERIRQWRHQLILDGALMDLGQWDEAAQRIEIERRWNDFVQELSMGEGGLDAFLKQAFSLEVLNAALCHDSSPPSNPVIRDEVLRLHERLRLRYQLEYARSKTASEGPHFLPTIGEFTETLDKAATTTFALAVGIIVARFCIGFFNPTQHTLIALAASATGLAVASAAIRALRSGLAVPGEQESYTEYGDRMQELHFRFQLKPEERWQILEDVETASVEELRRFLVTKSKSRFVVF
jgi:hypothetical protein